MKTRTMFLTIMSCLFVGLAAGAQTSAQRETADLLPEGTFTNGRRNDRHCTSGRLARMLRDAPRRFDRQRHPLQQGWRHAGCRLHRS